MDFIISDAVKEVIEKRGLKVDDVKKVISDAGDDRIYNGSKFIAKKEIGDITVYADYSVKGDNVTVNAGYCHKMKIQGIVLEGEDTEWKYCKNGAVVKKGHTDLSYIGATRSGPSLVEPVSGQSWIEEYLAAGALTAAEGLFQQKRA
ncbi:MAG: hypothetical protein WC067_02905 [Candidatus Methanomethylophilaceae archaeon]